MMTVKDCGAYMMIYMIWQIGRKIILVCLDVFFSIHYMIILGGRNWLVLTKGTDCTEAFETFHVFGVSSTVLQKFWVKKANTPRRYRYVIHNVFYKDCLLTAFLGSHSTRMDSSKHCKEKLQRFWKKWEQAQIGFLQ